MIETRMVQRKEGPFLRPAMVSEPGAIPGAVYCRLPSGRVRLPSRDRVASLCTEGRYHDCPVYRRARYLEFDVTGAA
jgi:hypothetical protein